MGERDGCISGQGSLLSLLDTSTLDPLPVNISSIVRGGTCRAGGVDFWQIETLQDRVI